MLIIKDLSKSYDGKKIINRLNCSLKPGERICVLGPSGSGKTTLLRLICGLEKPDDGEIRLDGSLISSADVMMEPHRRSVRVVFQDAALWPHLSVYQNIRFGIQTLPRDEQEQRVMVLLKAVGLQDFRERMPARLSGGEARRVALARALATSPKWLLMDEPLTNLDAELRGMILDLILQVVPPETGMVYITHDASEAKRVALKTLRFPQGVIEMAQNDS
jgi:ABC-type Fe3+/spermidine/putrescine transport system ATPase subunit